VPLEYARKRIAEARARTVASKQVLPMGLDAAKELLGDLTNPAEAKHPLDGEDLVVPSEENAVKARIEKSMHLHEEPEFASWVPDDPSGIALLESINQRVQKLGLQPGTPPTEELQKTIDTTVNEAIDEACNAYFDDDRKKLYIARLKDAAWSLYQAGIVDRAVDALLVAQAIERAGVISDRPSEIPFARGMFVKLIAIAQQRAAAMMPNGMSEAERLQG
jgi:anthranilate phosphoribosyltransferase